MSMSSCLRAAADGGVFSLMGGFATVGEGGALSVVGERAPFPHWLMNDSTANTC